MIEKMNRFISFVKNIIIESVQRFNAGEVVENRERIPTADIPFTADKWLRIEDVICVYIDMKNSTHLSIVEDEKFTAKVYQLFIETAVKILNDFEASYIDVRGDGAFGLFNKNKLYHALAAAISFKTFSTYELTEHVSSKKEISSHIGIDMRTVLVKRIGIVTKSSKTDRNNEVWAGKPVNMAAKLASLGEANDLIISPRVYKVIAEDQKEEMLKTCGCSHDGQERNGPKVDLWIPKEIKKDSRMNFDFNRYYLLKSNGWCIHHGADFCQRIMGND